MSRRSAGSEKGAVPLFRLIEKQTAEDTEVAEGKAGSDLGVLSVLCGKNVAVANRR